ncbi:tetratricopeptide repeat protein [Azospirillum sp. RWY-5-1]|uniref:protein O-GlcNAc transferase n=1 Tax=Azospirillum oleiclasticum TaxID=2735135 RepID=A0ABX2T4R5_9PROT|nr:tetratricopeptide repeat protein [Azospirillum oleiclasticum]NYZ19322.1 tetratricopeptide repeat protein [Azospirillum oleiclasticum]
MDAHRRTLVRDPENAAALAGLFRALDALGCKGTPEEAVARSNRAEGLRRAGRLEEAEAEHRAALRWLPRFGGIHFNLGVLLHGCGRLAEAAACYVEAARLMPSFAAANANAGAVLKDLGRLAEAERALRAAVRTDPALLAARLNLGAVLRDGGRLREATAAFRTAIALAPGVAESHANLALALKESGDAPGSIPAFERALVLGLPDAGGVLAQLVQQRRHLARWDGLAERSAALRDLVRRGASQQVQPWIFLSEGAGPAQERACAERYSAWRTRSASRAPALQEGRRTLAADGRLRVGYLSADYHEHATAVLIAELIERHDRGRVHVTGISYGPDDGGPMRRRLAAGFDRFMDVAALSHADAARRIAADGIDVLVDLKGHTQGARLEIMALRPAPVQAQWLGYPGTMGAPFIDYVIADPVVAPFDQQPHYCERIVHLPRVYQPNDRRRAIADRPTRADCGLPADGFVAACFNTAYKITPDLFAVWMRLLHAIPGSVLWLLESHPEAAANLRREAAARGVDPARLVFAPKAPLPEHLGRHGLADLFLDTLPYNAHTTASDALWAGLPLLTVRGEGFAARVAASLLDAAGLPELVCGSLAEYEAAALRLARSPDKVAALKARLAAGRSSSALFDTDRFARALERAFETMWTIHASGQPPRGFAVPDELDSAP